MLRQSTFPRGGRLNRLRTALSLRGAQRATWQSPATETEIIVHDYPESSCPRWLTVRGNLPQRKRKQPYTNTPNRLARGGSPSVAISRNRNGKKSSTTTQILASGGSPPRWLTVRAAHRRYSITLHKKRRAERFVVFVISLYRYRVFQALVRSE